MISRLRAMREAAGLSLVEASAALASTDTPIYFTSIHRLETGEIELTVRRQTALARIYGCHPTDLVSWEDEAFPRPQRCPCHQEEPP